MSDIDDVDIEVIDSDDENETYEGNAEDSVIGEEEDGVEDGDDDHIVEEGEDDGQEVEDDLEEGNMNESNISSNPYQDESSFVQSILGGAPPNMEEEELMVDRNKKIVHHDEVLMLHPESSAHNYDEIHKASLVTRNENNIIVDKLHTSMPILTKYEKAKILGQRTKQLNQGSEPFITWDRPTMDNSLIAEEELMQKKLPFIIQRPIPNGGFEYWHVKDLEVIHDY